MCLRSTIIYAVAPCLFPDTTAGAAVVGEHMACPAEELLPGHWPTQLSFPGTKTRPQARYCGGIGGKIGIRPLSPPQLCSFMITGCYIQRIRDFLLMRYINLRLLTYLQRNGLSLYFLPWPLPALCWDVLVGSAVSDCCFYIHWTADLTRLNMLSHHQINLLITLGRNWSDVRLTVRVICQCRAVQ